MSELLELCGSENLSLVTLQEMINTLGPRVSSQNQLCFHRACYNEKVTLKMVQILYHTLPGALRLRDNDGCLSIHWLCLNKNLDETTSLDILQFMLHNDPTLLREVDESGYLPIHFAVDNKSTSFCNILIDAYPESLRIESDDGWLPIHYACECGNRDDTADTIQYMLELDPELINAENSDGYLPIHRAAMNGGTKLIELLLKFGPDAATKENNDGGRWLPLHLACIYDTNLSSIQVLYDSYPEAILARTDSGRTPLDNARSEENTINVDFLETQLEYARQAQDMTAMTTLDENGWLPLQHALKGNASLGSIKLLLRGDPAALQEVDRKGAYPLHIACEFSSVKVVKYLVDIDGGFTLNNVDTNDDSPLHYACRGGNLGIVKYLLERNAPSVSDRNKKNKLAIHLLFECGENMLDRDSLEYVETIHRLLLANPEVVRDLMP